MSDADEKGQTPCEPCGGTGKVISNLGERTRKVTCPWCQGGGFRIAGADAQQWRAEQDHRPGARVSR